MSLSKKSKFIAKTILVSVAAICLGSYVRDAAGYSTVTCASKYSLSAQKVIWELKIKTAELRVRNGTPSVGSYDPYELVTGAKMSKNECLSARGIVVPKGAQVQDIN